MKKFYKGKNHWVVDFYDPWCESCENFSPELGFLAKMIKEKVKAGKVDRLMLKPACLRQKMVQAEHGIKKGVVDLVSLSFKGEFGRAWL